MQLKPQDTLLAIKYWSLKQDSKYMGVREIAQAISISPSEVSKGTSRLVAAKLCIEREGNVFAEKGALLEWLKFGVRYVYPQESVGYGRGIATSWNCPILISEMVPPSPALVWPIPSGDEDGVLIRPFHESIPIAASRDERLYLAMSLVEAIRGGKPRELEIARNILDSVIKNDNEELRI